jgi:hypothetical protein
MDTAHTRTGADVRRASRIDAPAPGVHVRELVMLANPAPTRVCGNPVSHTAHRNRGDVRRTQSQGRHRQRLTMRSVRDPRCARDMPSAEARISRKKILKKS